MTFLLSKLSEILPMGHWKKAPAKVIRTKRIEVSKIDKFITVAYTAVIVNIADIVKPVQNIATLPNGEVLNNSFTVIDPIFLNFGGFLLVKRIGIRAIENSREIKINGSYCNGLLKLRSIFPKANPKNVMNI